MMSNRKGCQTQSLIDHWQCPREASTSITNILCFHYYLVDDRVSANFTFQLLRYTLFFFYKNVVFPAQVEYSYFSADFRLKIFLYYS